jgi:RNA polymerase sigma-70 factor (ECF subfamily)
MQKAQGGDQDAYRCLLGSLVPAIRALVRRRVYDEALADDVVQDTLLTLHRVRHTYDPTRPMMPWIAAIAAARAIDGLRRQGRTQRREVWDEVVLAMELDPDATRQMEHFAVENELGRLLDLLPARQRQAVEMVKLQQMSLDHAAQVSHQSVPALKALLHRAFTRLRQHGNDGNA